MRRVVLASGGSGSWLCADETRRRTGGPIELLFADTLIEDDDLYRFLIEGSAVLLGVPLGRVKHLTERCEKIPHLGKENERRDYLWDLQQDVGLALPGLHWLADGHTPWDVFRDVRFLGNSRRARCSLDLKQKICREWLESNCDVENTTVYLGIHASEQERFYGNSRSRGAQKLWEPWRCEAPLCETPYLPSDEADRRLSEAGVRRPRLYDEGFLHNYCGGWCVKAGHGQYRKLLELHPDRYLYHERKEQEIREHLGKDVSILRDRRGGTLTPLTMRKFREDALSCDPLDQGGCGCFSDDPLGSDE